MTNPTLDTSDEELREKIEDLIVDTSLHPVDASLRILSLLKTDREKAVVEARIDENQRWKDIYSVALNLIKENNYPADSVASGFINTLTYHVNDFDDRTKALKSQSQQEGLE